MNPETEGKAGHTATFCKSNLATRPILYTDTINGQQVLRDDLWAVSTDELNACAELLLNLRALRNALGFTFNNAGWERIDEALAKAEAP